VKYLLDTCLISELIKKKPSLPVLRWLEKQDETALYLSVLTIGELQKGISKLPDNPKKLELQGWVNNELVGRFEGRILSIDVEVAAAWGKLLGSAEKQGRKLPVMDSLIAATANTHNLTVVTRNARDMERCQASVFNPWRE
jgi:predicted nucleic acid-binding protein